MKLIDLQFYAKKHSAHVVYLNHEDWLDILKELGYVDKCYEKCDYFHILPQTKAYISKYVFTYIKGCVRFVGPNSVVTTCENILSENERIIKYIIE